MFADDMTDKDWQSLKFEQPLVLDIPYSRQEGTNVGIQKPKVTTVVSQGEVYGPKEFIGPMMPITTSSTVKTVAGISILSVLGYLLTLKK